ncbi:hypothetical protein DFR65_104162 [Oceanihabitans sediminis]|uniref:DUF1684 domain-containing protein n=1 Tax=Oceanihabitans sediminis TaxID=1812012 RepID=A0A368P354_9FLAO|nr:DUF1684 domain-containing protein [Oceanihabitans sediminis]RBP30904.1 hypothetical protein DFR65_104162 [Oceanihabitans sediminis]RCU56866.1 DUF1684 domain-containing protein [Oceanihabitans sediminis]
MKNLIYLFLCISVFSCNDGKQPILGDTEWQREKNAEFKDASKSPLKSRDRKNFKSLDFFKFDSTFVVEAILKRTPGSEWFDMETTTERVSKERVYGIITFKINGNTYSLNVYQGQEMMQEKGFEDYLFLPYSDKSNGETTYGGGRYLDLRIPEGDTMVIDFNKTYNPYCVYNEKYSCPLVPLENYIDEEIHAGMKNFIP